MPIVHIELYSGRTAEQKSACARDVVDAIVKHLNTTAEATQVVFVDVDKSDWLVGGKIPAAGAKRE
jgi:4-oxalocrotonate tautomerase